MSHWVISRTTYCELVAVVVFGRVGGRRYLAMTVLGMPTFVKQIMFTAILQVTEHKTLPYHNI